MLFNSIDFVIFFPLVFVLYWVFSGNLKLRNIFLLICSYIFYGWWDYRFLGLIIFSSFIDFFIGKYLFQTNDNKKRKSLLVLSLLINLGLLTYFKYTNFLIDSFVNAFRFFGNSIEISTLSIILPVGISFYTFQTLSYTIDIYRNKIEPTNDIISFFTFVSFFPQLVAGPIERASDLLPQFQKTYNFDYERIKEGLVIILFGFFKKIVIADRLAILVNTVYNNPENYSGFELIIATVFFAFQILCDFSAYSDIAIGIAKTFGFELSLNFKRPYFSKSIPEFWRRWHITLGSWFKDYLYIPLGGNKVSTLKKYKNIMIVFVISGLWHGASWNFIIWGFIHGIYLIIDSLMKSIFSKPIFNLNKFSNRLFKVLLTFSLVCFAWIFFRANTFSDSVYIVRNIFKFNIEIFFNNRIYELGLEKREFNIAIISLFILLFIDITDRSSFWYKKLNSNSRFFRWSFYLLITMAIIFYGRYGDGSPSEFIYFQF